MTTPLVDAPARGFRAPGTTFMISGGIMGALGAYVFQVYGGRVLGTVGFAPVAALWTVFFILATILLVPVEQYVTREVASGRKALPHDLKPAMAMAAIGSVLGGVFVLVTLDRLFEGNPQYVAHIILLMVGYAFLFVGKGVLAGRRRFAGVGWVLIIETVARLAAGVIALQLLASGASLGWSMVLGGFAVLGMRWWRHDTGESRVRHLPASRFLAGYAGGTASSQLLLGGAPIAVAALGGSDALFSVIFVTFTLYRAPLTLIFALQGRILPYLVGLAGDSSFEKLSRIARIVVLGGLGLAAAGGLVGWVIGPEVVTVLFGEEFAPSATVAMLAAAGVVAAATAQVASQVLVAEGRTTRLSFAWLGGLVVGVVVLIVVGGEVGTRVATGFVAGEAAALGLMALLAIRR
jgi:O-antigen/teichoic acid export membrane protein